MYLIKQFLTFTVPDIVKNTKENVLTFANKIYFIY